MDQAKLLSHLIDTLETQRVPYAITGSHASMAFGEVRLTHDIDVVAGLTPSTLAAFCAAFPPPDYYVRDVAARAAAAGGGMFNIIHPESGLKIDVIVPTSDFDRGQLRRAVRAAALPGKEASFVAPEDLIIKKMEYFREGASEKHLRDIAGILNVTGQRIDREYIRRAAAALGLESVWEGILSNGH